MKNMKRLIQIITFIHRIHHIIYSYGYKIPLINIGWFDNYGFVWFGKSKSLDVKGNLMRREYHNCTLSGVIDMSENNILCHCGGGARTPHSVGVDKCFRYHVTDHSELPRNFRIDDRGFLILDVGTNTITDYTLKQQRGYSEDKCGNWTRPKSKDSVNSLQGDW